LNAVAALLVAIGGALGSLARWWVSLAIARSLGPAFPWGTLLANVSGCFVIGFVAGWSNGNGRLVESDAARNFAMVGFCGGYTTFSAFSLQTVEMLQAGDLARAGANVAASLVLCLVATWAGYALAAAVSRPAGAA
jgi:CrcB protein